MALQGSPQIFTPLRFVTQRLAATSAPQIFHLVTSLAAALNESKACFLAVESDNESHSVSEGPVLVHKIRIQISALLQDKSTEAQYAAVILIKTIVEVGGWSILQGASPWIRGLIGMLGRPAPAVTQKLCILCLTRIFILTQESPSLLRELTTPSLTTFLTMCLNLVKTDSKRHRNDVLAVILSAFNELIFYHPTSFRPFCAQIKALTLPLIAPTPSDLRFSDESPLLSVDVSDSARCLVASIPVCASRNGYAEEWAKCLHEMVECTHKTANLVFRALKEEDERLLRYPHSNEVSEYAGLVQEKEIKEPGFTYCTGISAGIERLEGLVETLRAFLCTRTSVPVVLPIGELVKVIERLLSVLPKSKDKPVQTRPEVSRDEREGLLMGVPRIQVSAIRLCYSILFRLGRDAAAVSVALLDQILLVLEAGAPNEGVRRAAYEVVSHVLDIFGSSLPQSNAIGLASCVRLCCEDLSPIEPSKHPNIGPSDTLKHNGPKNPGPTNASHYLGAGKSHISESKVNGDTSAAATALISSALTKLPHGFISSSLRQKIDRTAILSSNKDIMFASAMNPPNSPTKLSSTSSILPFLARAFPSHLETEAFIRPRMPPIQFAHTHELEPENDAINLDLYDNDNIKTNSPHTKSQHSEHPPADLKRPRQTQHSPETFLDTDASKNPATSDQKAPTETSFEANPHQPKRLKVVHASADPSPDPQPPPREPGAIREQSKHDVVMENAFAKAPETAQMSANGSFVDPVTEGGSAELETEGLIADVENVPQDVKGKEGGGEEESSESEIHEVEMDSLGDDDEDDEEEEEKEGEGM